ncbi:MAG TPA: substrate-binding protein [Dermatophilaceae bacterium]
MGALTDLTGAFGVVGKANKAVAEFTVAEINAAGGVMGRKIELTVVDSATDPSVGAQVAKRLVESTKVDMVIGGVATNMREAIRDTIATRGKTLYIWPAPYEGGECTPNVWSVGAVPNQQVDPIIEKLLAGGAKTFFLCGNDYAYPRKILARVREKVEAGGGRVLAEEYIPLTETDPSALVNKVLQAKADALFEIVVLPATVPFIHGLVGGGYKGKIAGTLFDEAINGILGADAKGLIGAQDYFASITDPTSLDIVKRFKAKYPDVPFSATFNSPDWYRGFYLWKTAVEKAGSTDLAKVNKAFDSVSYDKLVGGPAKMVPGTRHCALSMYVGEMQADGSVKVVDTLGQITPEGQC